MNKITIIQNEQKQLERMAAQRELYSSAKSLYGFQFIGSVFFPIIFAIISLLHFKIAVYAALFGIIFFLIDLIFISPIISSRKNKAAKIQELFDCDVLEIPKSPLKISNDIAVEEVLIYYEAHNKIKSNVEKLRDWYPQEISSVDIDYARLICQRTNCWWDAKLRIRYMNTLMIFSVCIPILIIIISFLLRMDIDNIVLIASSLMPFFRFANKEYTDHKAANDRLEKTHNYILKLWENLLNKCFHKENLIVESRMIQDEIYENRLKSPLILDFIYNIFRDNNENLMNKTASILVNEINLAS